MRIFISSTFDDEMLKKRDLIKHEISFRLNEIFNALNINVFIVDLTLGIPRNTPPLQVIEYCLGQISKSTVFIFILSKNQGTKIDQFLSDVDYTNSKYYKLINYSIKKGYTVLDLEFLFASLIHKNKILLFDRYSNVKEYLKKYENGNVQENEFIYFDKYSDLLETILDYFNDLKNRIQSERENVRNLVRNEAQLSLLASKSRYYVSNQENINYLYQYIQSNTRKSLIVYGKESIGKTSLLVNFWANLCNTQKYTVWSYFVGAESGLVNEMLIKLICYIKPNFTASSVMSDEYTLINLFLKYFDKVNSNRFFFKKLVIIIDGIDKLHNFEKFDLNWFVRRLSRKVKVIISLRDNKLYKKNKNCIFYKVKNATGNEIIKKVFREEGKELEIPYINELLEQYQSYFKELSPYNSKLLSQILIYESNYNNLWSNGEKIIKSYKRTPILYLNLLIQRYGKNSVYNFFKYLIVSKHGLTFEFYKAFFSETINIFADIFYYVHDELNFIDRNHFKVNENIEEAFIEIFNLHEAEIFKLCKELYFILDKLHEREDILWDEQASLLYKCHDSDEMFMYLANGYKAGFLFENAKQYFVQHYFNLVNDKVKLILLWRYKKETPYENMPNSTLGAIIQTIIEDNTLTYCKEEYIKILTEMLKNKECFLDKYGRFISVISAKGTENAYKDVSD